MESSSEQTVYQSNLLDNVATALTPLAPGETIILGERTAEKIQVTAAIQRGHKIALKAILPEEDIVKYGVVIGRAKKVIAPGAWVHLHNITSNYDQRSETLDVDSGAPTDIIYE